MLIWTSKVYLCVLCVIYCMFVKMLDFVPCCHLLPQVGKNLFCCKDYALYASKLNSWPLIN